MLRTDPFSFNTGGKPGGRDHNPKGFTYWMAGAGVKAGTSYGETDELGEASAVDRRHLRDLHATILHLMGLDHEKLTYFYGGLNNKLTGVIEAHPIRGIIAGCTSLGSHPRPFNPLNQRKSAVKSASPRPAPRRGEREESCLRCVLSRRQNSLVARRPSAHIWNISQAVRLSSSIVTAANCRSATTTT